MTHPHTGKLAGGMTSAGMQILRTCSRCQQGKPVQGGVTQGPTGARRWICLDCRKGGTK